MVAVAPVYSGSAVGTLRGAAGGGRAGAGGRTSAGVSWRAYDAGAGFSIVPTSSPFPAMTAIGVFTATWSVPSGITILARTPSSMASTSIVALSVSISASTSPALTASPSLLIQRAIFPSVIVGDSAGIRTWVAMGYHISCGRGSGFRPYIRPQLRRIGLRAILRELRGFSHEAPDRSVNLLQRRLSRPSVEQTLPRLINRVVLGPHPVDFFPGPVLRRVGHRVATIAVSHHLEDDWALAGAGMLGGGKTGFMYREHVHAVDLLALNAICHAAMKEIGAGRGAVYRCPHPVAVVFDHVNDRQLPQRGHVEALVDLPLIDRAVAEIGDRDRPVPAIMVSKAEPGSDRNLRADDAVPAKEVFLPAEHVHRAAFAVRITAAAPGQLGHDALGVHAAGQHMPVIPIGGDDRVNLLERRLHTDDDRLLPNIEVTKAADQPHAVHLTGPLLEAPDQQHVAVILKQFLRRDAEIGKINGRGVTFDSHVVPSGQPAPTLAACGERANLPETCWQTRPIATSRRMQGTPPIREGLRPSTGGRGLHDDSLAGRDEVQGGAHAFVEQVGIEVIRLEVGHLQIERLALRPDRFELDAFGANL